MEVAIAMTIFAMLALGITAGTLQARKMAFRNILENTAYTIAQAYLEQIRGTNSGTFEEYVNDDTKTITTYRIALNPDGTPVSSATSSLTQKQANTEQIVIDFQDTDASGVSQGNRYEMEMEMTPEIEALDYGSYLIKIDFRYRCSNLVGPEWNSGSVRAVRTLLKNSGS